MTPARTLHTDARTTLQNWVTPDRDQEALRMSFLAHLTKNPDGLSRGCQPDHVTSSAIVVRGDEALLVFHSKAGKWLQMGGHCEDTDPTLAAAALREATEESGIQHLVIDPIPLRLSKHLVPFCTGGHHLDVQFLAAAPTGAQTSIADHEDDAAWFRLDPSAVPEPTDQDVRELIAAAMWRLRGNP